MKIPVSRDILNSVAKLDHFRGTWAAGTAVPPDRLARLRDASRIRSVGASCRMSGVRVTDAEVAALLCGEAPAVRDGADVLGYAEAMDRSFPGSGPLVTPDEIRRFVGILLALPGNPPEPAPWREKPIHLEAFDAEGRALGKVYQTLPPRLIAEKMEELCSWLEMELRAGEQHPVLVIAAFLLAILAVGPFERGNGRAARLLGVHLLRRAGYAHLPYSSFEGVLEEMRDTYHEALDASETHFWQGEADLEPWVRFYLGALSRHRERVEAKLDVERRASDLTPLQRSILDAVREHGTVGAAVLLAATGTNRNTLKDNVHRLVVRGFLQKLGERRGTTYRLATGEGQAGTPSARKLEPVS